jgi:predicted transcriptional regulator
MTIDLDQEALRLLHEREEFLALHRDEGRRKIDEGWAAARRGEFVDGDESMDQLEAELDQRERSPE